MKIIGRIFEKPYLAVLLTLVVAVLCFLPSDSLPPSELTFMDKIQHFLAFAALSFCWRATGQSFIAVLIGLLLYAIFIEIVQFNLPPSFKRSFDYFDIVADCVGALIGLLTYWVVRSVFPGLVTTKTRQ